MWINLLEANTWTHDELLILIQAWYKKYDLQSNFLREKEEKTLTHIIYPIYTFWLLNAFLKWVSTSGHWMSQVCFLEQQHRTSHSSTFSKFLLLRGDRSEILKSGVENPQAKQIFVFTLLVLREVLRLLCEVSFQ